MVSEALTRLITLYRSNKLSHAYLIETNNPEKCFQDLLYVIKNISCSKSYNDNCEECNLCYLIEQNNLPSLKIIEPDGASIKKEQIAELKKIFSSMPVFTENNIYIIKSAEKLNSSSANTMLKFLEEPDDNIIGFFITNNINNMIPTIESRCEIIRNYYNENLLDLKIIVSNPDYQEYLEVACKYLNKIEVEKMDSIMYNRDVLLSKFTEKDDIVMIFKIILAIYESKLNSLSNECLLSGVDFINKISYQGLLKRVKLVMTFLEDINSNVNKELLLDKFVIELGDINESI